MLNCVEQGPVRPYGQGQFSLSTANPNDGPVTYVANPAPNASPPLAPTDGYRVVSIDRNKP